MNRRWASRVNAPLRRLAARGQASVGISAGDPTLPASSLSEASQFDVQIVVTLLLFRAAGTSYIMAVYLTRFSGDSVAPMRAMLLLTVAVVALTSRWPLRRGRPAAGHSSRAGRCSPRT